MIFRRLELPFRWTTWLVFDRSASLAIAQASQPKTALRRFMTVMRSLLSPAVTLQGYGPGGTGTVTVVTSGTVTVSVGGSVTGGVAASMTAATAGGARRGPARARSSVAGPPARGARRGPATPR